MSRIVALDNIRIDHTFLMDLASFFSGENGTALLYSGGQYDSSKKSFLFLFPFDFIWVKGGKQWRTSLGTQRKTYLSMSNPWDAYKILMPEFSKHNPFPEWVGFFGYEMGAFSDLEKRLPCQPAEGPDSYLQRCAIVLAVDHQTETGTLCIADQAEYFLDEKQRRWVEYLANKNHWPELRSTLSESGREEDLNHPLTLSRPIESRSTYVDKVEQARELIRAGDIYQINLSQQFSLSGKRSPFHLFRKLATINPAPFSAFLRIKDFAIVSSSPERFLHRRGCFLETRPIKGTMPRGKSPEEDAQNRETLMSSPKEKAELLMITDLMRNDLAKVSLPGSVKTENIWACEEYANVFHLLSIIQSIPMPDIHPVDIIRSCFPGGSITGCPKLSAMEVIAKLEKRNRGVYTGAIGYFSGNGDFDFNIAIRTIVISGESIDVQLGGAIVADSDPNKEYDETMHKGASIFTALGVGGLNIPA